MTRGAPDIPFATEETVRAIARDSDEPDWVLEDRLEAIRRFSELPVEPNQLFTPYVDLRGVRFGEIRPYTVIREAPRVEGTLPAGAAAFIHVR